MIPPVDQLGPCPSVIKRGLEKTPAIVTDDFPATFDDGGYIDLVVF